MDSKASEIGQILLQKGQTLATAESCTGGNIAHLLTLTPGCSSWFRGGIVSYTNHVKINLLGVAPQTINRYGVVSREVAMEMANGARRATSADYAISTTGIAGPDGGTAENPVGTVCIGIATPYKIAAERIATNGNRADNISTFSNVALGLLLSCIK